MIKLYRLLLAVIVSETLFGLFHEKSFAIQDAATGVNSIALYKNSILQTSSIDVLEKDIQTGLLVRTFRAHSSLITALAVSDDFRMITSGFDNMIVVWDLETGSVIRRISLAVSDAKIQRLALVNDQLFTCGFDWIVRQVNWRSGRVAKTIDMGASVSCVAADNELLYVGYTTAWSVIDRIEITSFVLGRKLIGHTSSVTALLVHGVSLYSGSYDNTIICWNLDKDKVLRTFIGHSLLISSLVILNDNLYSGAYDSTIIKWNINTGELIARFPQTHYNFVKCLAGRDQSLFSGADDTYVIWWNLNSMQANLIYKSRNKMIRSIALWKSTVLGGVEDFTIRIWDTSVQTLDPLAVLTGHGFPVNAISVNNDDLFSGSSDKAIRHWNLLSLSYVKEFVGHSLGITTLEAKNSFLYSGSYDLRLKKWDISSGNMTNEYIGHIGGITHLTVVSGFIFSGGFEKRVLMWEEETASIEKSFEANTGVFAVFVHDEFIYAALAVGLTRFLLASPSEHLFYEDFVACYCILHREDRLYTGHHDGLIRSRDPISLVILETFQGHTDTVLSLCFDFSGILYSGGLDGSIKKWNIPTRNVAFSFEDRLWSVSAVSAIDNRLLVGLKNGFFAVYSVGNASLLNSGYLHEEEVTALIVDKKALYSSSLDGIIRKYSFQTGKTTVFFDTEQIPIRHFVPNQNNFVILKGEYEIGFIDTTIPRTESFSLSSPLPLLCLAVSENIVTAGAKSGAVLVWDIETKRFLFDFKGHSAQVNSLLIKENSIYSASDDKVIIEWSTSNRGISRKFERLSASSLGHLGPVNSLSICGDTLFSGGDDLATRRWNLIKGNHEDVYLGPSKPVTVVLCHNKTVFTGSEDYSVLMYRPTFVEDLTPTSSSSKAPSPSKSSKSLRVVNSLRSNTSPNSIIQSIVVGVTLVFVFVTLLVVFLRWRQLKNNKASDSITLDIQTKTDHFVIDLKTVVNTVIGISKHAAFLLKASDFASNKKIAVGGGGELYLASVMNPVLRNKIGKTVIQKIVFVKNNAGREGFYQEVGIMIMLEPFPYFCRILGYTESPMSIILEYYPDGSLNEWIRRSKCSKSILLKILGEVSQGLDVMHSHYLAHCDVKSSNILVHVSSGIPTCLITDFGITQVLSESIIAAKSFQIMNLRGLSIQYAAPESIISFRTKEYSRVNFRMFDVYSFACLTYEVQSGKTPWH